jgi:hypothetical protein
MPRLTLAVAALVVALLSGCVATGPQPAESIPPALLASDLDIADADAGTSNDGLSVNVWASFQVERDEFTADELREVLSIVVANTHISNINAISIIGTSDETEVFEGFEQNVYLDLVPAAEELGLENQTSGRTGSIAVDWDDVVDLLGDE